jgi:hypothetical protein
MVRHARKPIHDKFSNCVSNLPTRHRPAGPCGHVCLCRKCRERGGEDLSVVTHWARAPACRAQGLSVGTAALRLNESFEQRAGLVRRRMGSWDLRSRDQHRISRVPALAARKYGPPRTTPDPLYPSSTVSSPSRLAQVKLQKSRPLSKMKSHVVAAILRREDGSEPPSPFPNVHLAREATVEEVKQARCAAGVEQNAKGPGVSGRP